MSQTLPDHIEALIDHGSTVHADHEIHEAFAFMCEVAGALDSNEITDRQAEALVSMLGFSREDFAALRRSN